MAEKTADDLWRDLEGFERPKCPRCGHTATLDEDGYYCERCSDPNKFDPEVDDIPNGAEFAETLEAYRQLKGLAAPSGV